MRTAGFTIGSLVPLGGIFCAVLGVSDLAVEVDPEKLPTIGNAVLTVRSDAKRCGWVRSSGLCRQLDDIWQPRMMNRPLRCGIVDELDPGVEPCKRAVSSEQLEDFEEPGARAAARDGDA